MSDDQVRRSYAALQALKDNAPAYPDAEYVAQYHHELDRLEQLGFDVNDWRIPDGWLKHRVLIKNTLSGRETRSEQAQIQQYQLFVKLDAVLHYFAVGDRPIGFEGPRRKA